MAVLYIRRRYRNRKVLTRHFVGPAGSLPAKFLHSYSAADQNQRLPRRAAADIGFLMAPRQATSLPHKLIRVPRLPRKNRDMLVLVSQR